MSKRGLFIVIDGPSGSGKDSAANQLLKDLSKFDVKAVSIQETKEKNYDREKILLAKEFGDRKTAKAIINERKKIYQIKIIPQLSAGKIVIANRGEPSTLVYQTLKQEITVEDVWGMHRKENILLPDLVIILNCSIEEALRRKSFKEFSSDDKDKNSMSGKFAKSFAGKKQVHANYEKLKDFLEKKGVFVLYLKNDKISVEKQSKIIVGRVQEKLKPYE